MIGLGILFRVSLSFSLVFNFISHGNIIIIIIQDRIFSDQHQLHRHHVWLAVCGHGAETDKLCNETVKSVLIKNSTIKCAK